MEINIGLICSCTTSLKPFFNHFKSQVAQRGLRSRCGLVPGGPPRDMETTIHGFESMIEMRRYRSVETTDGVKFTPLTGTPRMLQETRDADSRRWDPLGLI